MMALKFEFEDEDECNNSSIYRTRFGFQLANKLIPTEFEFEHGDEYNNSYIYRKRFEFKLANLLIPTYV